MYASHTEKCESAMIVLLLSTPSEIYLVYLPGFTSDYNLRRIPDGFVKHVGVNSRLRYG